MLPLIALETELRVIPGHWEACSEGLGTVDLAVSL